MIKQFVFFISAIALCVSAIVNAKTVAANTAVPHYVGGYPTPQTAEAMFDEYDYQAATQFYVWAYPYLNSLGMEKGFAKMGGNERSFYMFDKLMQPQHVVMTANSLVIYNWTRLIDLSKGPVVVEVPKNTRGHFYDIGMRAYADTGDIGADKSQGGKYLLVSNEYKGEIPDGYFVVRSTYSDLITYAFRTFLGAEGGVAGAVKRSEQVKWYYLSEASNPPHNEQIYIGDRSYSQEWPRDERAFEWLSEAFNRDKVPDLAKAHLGNMRRLGLVKGKPFTPDKRAQHILKRAAKTGEAMVLSMAFSNRQDLRVYDNRRYEQIFTHRSSVFVTDNYEEVEQRAGGWHQLVGNFAQYVPAKAGTGGFYMAIYRDQQGEPLLGQHTYRLHVPAKVPVKQFWQIPVYETATRSMINTSQHKSTLSGTDPLVRNEDGSVDLYFAPTAPPGFEKNWIKTIEGQGWFSLPRLFAPKQAILDKKWRWNDIKRVK